MPAAPPAGGRRPAARRDACVGSLTAIGRRPQLRITATWALLFLAVPSIGAVRPPPGSRTRPRVPAVTVTDPATVADPRAWVVVDGDTGALVDGHDVHLRLRPASTVKVLTALVAVAALQPDDPVPVSATAARMPPESAGMRAGETWRADDVLHLLLMASDNDAAVALAERVSGGRAGFARDMQATARQLGLVDDPVLDDPSGLDDSAAFGRGDWISAYDLAIVARAALAVPTIRDVVGRRTPYRLKRPDGRVEDVRPQNKLLADPGVIGVKPGYTAQADETLIAAAVHDGRTVITVELGARPAAMYAVAKQLLAKGFAAPVGSQGPLPRLPAVVVPQRVVGNASAWPKSRQPASSGDGSGPVAAVVAGVVIVALTWHLGSRRRGRRSLGRGPTGDRTP